MCRWTDSTKKLKTAKEQKSPCGTFILIEGKGLNCVSTNISMVSALVHLSYS